MQRVDLPHRVQGLPICRFHACNLNSFVQISKIRVSDLLVPFIPVNPHVCFHFFVRRINHRYRFQILMAMSSSLLVSENDNTSSLNSQTKQFIRSNMGVILNRITGENVTVLLPRYHAPYYLSPMDADPYGVGLHLRPLHSLQPYKVRSP